MKDTFAMRDATTAAIDPFPLRLVKRALLILLGPVYFLFIAFAPWACAKRKGFKG